MNYVKKTQFALILYTKSHSGAIFGPTCMYKKLRNCRTVPPGASQIWCQNMRETWKKKVIKCRGVRALRVCRVIARNVEGGGLLGPPPVFLGLSSAGKWYFLHVENAISPYRRRGGHPPPPTPSPPLGRFAPSDDGASRHHILDTDFLFSKVGRYVHNAEWGNQVWRDYIPNHLP